MAGIALLQVQIPTSHGFNMAPSDACLALALVVGNPRLRIRRGVFSPWHVALLGVFTASIFLGALRDGGLSQYAVLNKFAGLLVLTALYLAFTSYADDWPRLEEMRRFFALAVSLGNALMLLLFFVPPLDALWAGVLGSSARYAHLRLCGMLIDPNAYGGLLVATFAVLYVGQDRRERTSAGRRVLDNLAALTLVLGIVFTFSRSAWMALAGLFAFSLFRRSSSAPKLALAAAVAIALSVAVGAISVDTMAGLANRVGTVSDRVEINEDAFRMFAENPILGGGIGAFRARHEVIIHNTTMWFLAEFGLVGLAVFIGFTIWFFDKGWKSLQLAPPGRRALVVGLIAAHASLVIFSMGIEALYQRHWWLVLAMIGAAHHVSANVRDDVRGAPGSPSTRSRWPAGSPP
ncbi:MAG: O-antigen ligase family protein [Thermoanaerobaculia bacterium]|nr:O-antigen ligase family protein [Thermoanaerobaculia bacterium]